LYLEEAFQAGIGNDPQQMVNTSAKSPRFEMMRRSRLTKSYRFGPELAELLDRHFYGIGLKSMAETGTTIRMIGCDSEDAPGRQRRQSPGEVQGIVDSVYKWLKWDAPDKGTLAILTPYKTQVALLKKELWQFRKHSEYYLIEVLNVHKSQGREWDSIFFSASDGSLPGNNPFWTESNDPEGALVLNTAISRAKRHLRFFVDNQFWKTRRPSSLLTEIAQAD
jgi:superfamily I DNA and/or RNA helicase